jgi:hypothetical protein
MSSEEPPDRFTADLRCLRFAEVSEDQRFTYHFDTAAALSLGPACFTYLSIQLIISATV